jgi:hypothetical protein
MQLLSAKPTELNCPAYSGTKFLAVKQPAQPDRVYPARCERCDGKGWITELNRGGLLARRSVAERVVNGPGVVQ